MIMMFTACSDELENGTRYADGMLHFKFLFDKQGQWNNDGTTRTQTELLNPVEFLLPDGLTQPLYLHCTEIDTIDNGAFIDTAAVTRGERITEEAFDERGKIKCFGLYAKVGSDEVIPFNTEVQRSDLTADGGWYVKDQDLTFPGDETWTSGKTGDFYGFAPFPGADSDDSSDEDYNAGHARCVTVDLDEATGTVPTITFSMQPEERKNKDILTAQNKGITYDTKNADGVELQFRHVLTAVKFKLEDGNELMYPIGVDPIVNHYIQVKSIKLKNIYAEGTAEIGKPWTDEASRLSYWTYDATEDNLGDCTTSITRTHSEITDGTAADDVKKYINTDDNCFMVLPQTTPAGAKVIITADITTGQDGTGVVIADAKFEAPINGQAWKAGYTYTYKISKSSLAVAYTLTSTLDGGATTFSFPAEGGAQNFDVLSMMQSKEAYVSGAPTVSEGTPWHIEYSEDGGTTWKQGVPKGFTLRDEDGNLVGTSTAIPGSTAAKTYTLTAVARTDGSPTLSSLQTQGYVGGDDGYYDLSTHGIGYGADQTARNTANCYIVQGYGKFELPIVYGNAIKSGVDNKIAYNQYTTNQVFWVYDKTKTAKQIQNPYINADTGRKAKKGKVVWQDKDNIIRQSSVSIYTATGDDVDGTTYNNDHYDKQFLRFEITQQDVYPGNALVAALDEDDKIMWSWHIWVTAQDYTETVTVASGSNSYDIAMYNLGWRTPELSHASSEKNYQVRVVQNASMGQDPIEHDVIQHDGYVIIGGSNLVYQHGRKDPFPSTSVAVDNITFNGSGGIQSITYKQIDRFAELSPKMTATGLGDDAGFQVSDGGVKMPPAHQRPTKLYRSPATNSSTSDWALTYSGSTQIKKETYNRWDPPIHYTSNDNGTTHKHHDVTKTIYDPSPVGFVVPPAGIAEALEATGTNTAVSTMEYEGATIDVPIPYIQKTVGEKTLRFYKNGTRRTIYFWEDEYTSPGGGSTDPIFGLANFKEYGFIWTGGIKNGDTYGFNIGIRNDQVQYPVQIAISKDKYSGDITYSDAEYYVAQALAVRPIKDVITKVEGGSATAQEFKQVDIKDVELKRKTFTGNATSNTQTWGLDYTSNTTLSDFVSSTSYQKKKVYIRSITVYLPEKTYKPLVTPHTYYGYNGRIQGLAKPNTTNRFSITYNKQTEDGDAFTTISSIPDHYIFYNGIWERLNVSDLTDWTSIVSLKSLRMDISRVVVDLRVTYLE